MDLPFSYHYQVENDLERLSSDVRRRVFEAIEQRLGKSPEKYGDPLRETLKGLWKLRIGDYRVVYEVDRESGGILIWGVIHRKDVYEIVEQRWRD